MSMKSIHALMVLVAVVAGAMSSPVAAQSAPFGLRPGMSLEELRKLVSLKKVKDYQYSSPGAPRGHSAFDDYRYLITPQHGLCKVTAWTPSITSDAHGGALSSKFRGLSEALSQKYGEPKVYDYLKSGSIWNDPRDWMMGLYRGERVLASFWVLDANEPPAEVESIALEAAAYASTEGMVSASYELRGAKACMDWIKAEQNSSL